MTYSEIHKAIVDITREKCTECQTRLNSIPKENVTEKKAVSLEYGIYTFCGNAGLLFNTTGEGSNVVLQRGKNHLKYAIGKYPKLSEVYLTLDQEEKLRFIAAIQGELLIRDTWLSSQYAELSEAEASGDTKKTFEYKIKIGAALNMLAAWENWRQENNIYPNLFEEDEK